MQQIICIDGAPCAVKVACTVRSGGKSALTTELIMGSAKAADYLSLWARPRGLPVHHQPHLDGAGAGHCCQQLSDHQPGRRGRQVPGHLADRPGHLAHHRAQAGACAHPAPDGVLNDKRDGSFLRAVPRLLSFPDLNRFLVLVQTLLPQLL